MRRSAVIVTDTLPSVVVKEGKPAAEVKVQEVTARGEGPNGKGSPEFRTICSQQPVTKLVSCTYEEDSEHGAVLAGETIVVTIVVSIPADAEALGPNSATVSGGGAPSASIIETTPLGADGPPFGPSFFDLETVGEGGEADTQAGSHPFELTTSFAFNVSGREAKSAGNSFTEPPLANASVKDLEVALPPGLVGNPTAVPRCSQHAFLEHESPGCPLDSQVGTVKTFFYGTLHSAVFPVYDIEPPPGQPAELGFNFADIGHVPLFLHVRSDGDYGLTAQLNDIPEIGPLQGAILTLWGVPAAASHDLEREGTRGEGSPEEETCRPSVEIEEGVEEDKRCPSGIATKPFLTLPTGCQPTPLAAVVEGDSWQNPIPPPRPELAKPAVIDEALTGCEQLVFDPSLTFTPETTQAGAPSGYTLDVHVPQDEDPIGLATPALRTAVVSLPAGAVISPSAASGLRACSPQQFGLHTLTQASCPAASRIGTAKVLTPLLTSPLEGEVFLGEPECAPCTPAQAQEGKLLRLLVQVQGEGVTVKLEGVGAIDQATGQLTVAFREAPQLPFEDVQLTLDGGPKAPLANATTCGTPQAASAQLTPYSSETPAQPTSEAYELSGCPTPQFRPSFLAGTTNNQAGAFSPLTVALSRTDADEPLESLAVRLPPGLLGMLSSVQLCPSAQAQAGTCAPQSRIGGVSVTAGPGADPAVLSGSVYLTGPREGTPGGRTAGGAPFGLSIVVPAQVGPLNLGTIVLGARVNVDPRTAALTITSDPLPQRVDGIPLQLKAVSLDIDREGFTFNPTDCEPLAVQGTLGSSAGTTAAVSSRFQAANCATLRFKPKLTALARARASKAGGVHLHVRIVAPRGEANIAKLKVDLPRRLVARLSTLQRACMASVFEANPARCPAASVVGTALVRTPILHYPLFGPVYVLSRGGAAQPEIALVLQTQGVVLEVVGQAHVKGPLVSATFRSLPDAPLSSVDLELNAGPHSLLGANLPASARGSLCGRRMAMETEITGQNGAVVKQSTIVSVSGCGRGGKK